MPATHQPLPTDFLFVYGTLMQQFANPYARQLRQQSRFVDCGHLPGQLFRVSWFPGAVPDPTATTFIHGEIYQLHNPTEALPVLDEYEDTAVDGSGIYIRKALSVHVGSESLMCWIYTYNASTANLVLIEGGRFTKE
ncbi:MAG: gamma-glutamylcyclotransferase [Rudanella sp.]|nr:gamma-glutamylcyclotransferase [Rudanella sp.]